MSDETAGDDAESSGEDGTKPNVEDDADATVTGDTEPERDIDPETVLAEIGDQPVLLFDGVCNLCNGTIQWIIPRDTDAVLAFAPLQSPIGTAVQERYGLDPDDLDSVLLVDNKGLYTKSTAAIRVAELLGWPYTFARAGRPIPRGLRDRLYDFVADNRYNWFGRKDQCMVPDDDISDRFLG